MHDLAMLMGHEPPHPVTAPTRSVRLLSASVGEPAPVAAMKPPKPPREKRTRGKPATPNPLGRIEHMRRAKIIKAALRKHGTLTTSELLAAASIATARCNVLKTLSKMSGAGMVTSVQLGKRSELRWTLNE